MIDIIDAYKIVNTSVLDVIRSVNPLKMLEDEDRSGYVRVRETGFNTAERSYRLTNVVVAHDLMQYMNRFHSIVLREKSICYMDILWDLDYENFSLAGFGGKA